MYDNAVANCKANHSVADAAVAALRPPLLPLMMKLLQPAPPPPPHLLLLLLLPPPQLSWSPAVSLALAGSGRLHRSTTARHATATAGTAAASRLLLLPPASLLAALLLLLLPPTVSQVGCAGRFRQVEFLVNSTAANLQKNSSIISPPNRLTQAPENENH